MANTATRRDGFPAMVTAMMQLGETWLRAETTDDRRDAWASVAAAGGDSGGAAALVTEGLDLLAGRLDALRREVRRWGARLWLEEADAAAGLPGRLRLLDDLAALLAASRLLPPLREPRFAGPVARIRELYEAEERFYRFGSWRLIPFNEARRARLAEIAEARRYLFPWYEEWSDVPADALDRLAAHLAGHPAAGLEAGRLALLREEVERDPEDAANLARCVFGERELPHAAARAWALRWLTAAETAASAAPAAPRPADVLPLLREIRQGAPAPVWRLKAACLLPGLERRERLRLLRRAEAELDTALAQDRAGLPDWLLAWVDGDTDDDALIARLAGERRTEPERATTRPLDRAALLRLLTGEAGEAGALAEALGAQLADASAPPRNAEKRRAGRGEGGLSGLLPGLRLSFRWPTLALGTAAASLLLALTVLHQPDRGAPVMLTMQVFGHSGVQLRGGGADARPELSPPFELRDGGALATGDYYRIRASADRDVFVWLLASSDDGPPVLVMTDKLRAGEARDLPGDDRLFRLEGGAGTERLYLLAAERDLPVRETLARGLPDGREDTLARAFPGAVIRAFVLEHR